MVDESSGSDSEKTKQTINFHKFKFEISQKAARFNTKLLKQHQYDLTGALKKEDRTVLEMGSEFSPIEGISSLFRYHRRWEKVSQIVNDGVTYHSPELDEELNIDIEAMITGGNHKYAKEKDNIPNFIKNYTKKASTDEYYM